MRLRGRFRYLIVAATLLLLVTSSLASAAPLSGGNTIYVINGEDLSFTFDPIVRKDGNLIPEEVVRAIGLSITTQGADVTLVKGPVRADLTLGRTVAKLNGVSMTVKPEPLRLIGKLFLPAELLEEFGFEIVSEGNLMQIRDLTSGLEFPESLGATAFESLKQWHSLSGSVRTDDGRPYLELELTYLTPQLVASDSFRTTFRQRAEFLSYLQTNTLVMARVINRSTKSATLAPASLMLVDQASGAQYDVERTLNYNGLISEKIASGAFKTSILVYPKLPVQLTSVTVFADTNAGPLGSLNVK